MTIYLAYPYLNNFLEDLTKINKELNKEINKIILLGISEGVLEGLMMILVTLVTLEIWEIWEIWETWEIWAEDSKGLEIWAEDLEDHRQCLFNRHLLVVGKVLEKVSNNQPLLRMDNKYLQLKLQLPRPMEPKKLLKL